MKLHLIIRALLLDSAEKFVVIGKGQLLELVIDVDSSNHITENAEADKACQYRSSSLQGPEGAKHVDVVTVYAAQAPEQQMLVFNPAPYNSRKVRAGSL